MKDVKTKAPGKLYVAGEYAVVEAGYSAIIAAINSFVYIDITESASDVGSIYSEGFTEEPVNWIREEGQITMLSDAHALSYVQAAIQITEQYLSEQGIPLSGHHIEIRSELDDEEGHKFGLGSSGAVTVAVVQGLLAFYEMEMNDLLIYKLSVLSQMKLGVNSSFGDLAAITFSGWIQYTNFERPFVEKYAEKHSITDTIEAYWPKLMIKRLRVPKSLHFLVGWTGSPASSNDLVGAVQDKKELTADQYAHFLEESKASVNLLVMGLEENHTQKIREAIHRNREALVQMGRETNVIIETPDLKKLCNIAVKHGGVAKTSGAGGGDSGIAFVFNKKQAEKITAEWENEGITPLPLKIHKKH